MFEAKKMTLKEIVAAEMSDDCFGVLINDIFSVLKYEPNLITNVSYPLVIVQNRLKMFRFQLSLIFVVNLILNVFSVII